MPFGFKWPDIRFQWDDVGHLEEKPESCHISEIEDEIVCDKVPIVKENKSLGDCLNNQLSQKFKDMDINNDETIMSKDDYEGSYQDLFYVTNESDEKIYAPNEILQDVCEDQNGVHCRINEASVYFFIS